MIKKIFSLGLCAALTIGGVLCQHNAGEGIDDVEQIIGGDLALAEEFPWMVSVIMSDGSQGCGATLIRPDWVLTAGHCDLSVAFEGAPGPSKVIVNSLVYNAEIDQLETYSEIISVEAVIIHEDFDFNSTVSVGDIALLKLATESTVSPVELGLDSQSALYEHEDDALVLGWGLTEDADVSTVLLKADCKFFGQSECETLYENSTETDFIANSGTICAGYFEGDEPAGAAAGDSGGPLLFLDNGEYKQIGVVSRGNSEMTELDFPGIFTLVTDYEEWINESIDDYESSVSINEEESSLVELEKNTMLYPIPFNDVLSVIIPKGVSVQGIYVSDMEGRIVFESNQLLSEQLEIKTDDWSHGSYIMRIMAKNAVVLKKIVK